MDGCHPGPKQQEGQRKQGWRDDCTATGQSCAVLCSTRSFSTAEGRGWQKQQCGVGGVLIPPPKWGLSPTCLCTRRKITCLRLAPNQSIGTTDSCTCPCRGSSTVPSVGLSSLGAEWRMSILFKLPASQHQHGHSSLRWLWDLTLDRGAWCTQ